MAVTRRSTPPFDRLHFNTDAPVSIKSIFYVPQSHMEKWGMARQDCGVNLYCRKVLIQARCDNLLPEWMRFIKGVVDSEDLPLNISRETMQAPHHAAAPRRCHTPMPRPLKMVTTAHHSSPRSHRSHRPLPT